MNPEKNLFTKFIQVYTSNFLQDALCQRKEGQGSDKSLHRVPYCSWRRVSQVSVLL